MSGKFEMKNYIGTKTLQACVMNLGDYNNYRGWTIPENEDPKREGYFVLYPDGYQSWSPKEVFEDSYRESGKMNFGHALEYLEQGKRVCRSGWNGKGMFVFMRPADELPILFVSKGIRSLPQSVKDFYYQDCVDENGKEFEKFEDDDTVKFTAYFCLKVADGTV